MKRRAKESQHASGQRHRQHTGTHVVSINGAADQSGSFPLAEPQACRSQDSDSGQESVAASDVAVAGASSREGLNYRNPKNFAERLMNVLERGIASDCIWWVGEGINGVALQPKKLKKGTLLQDHFSGNKYSAFLRSFNRWGFRRVAFHDVPDGAVVYKNCLFCMDKPHLVKHMRMDSDVQDVFERHQLSGENSSRGSTPSDAASSLPAARTLQGPNAAHTHLPTVPNGNNNVANMLQSLLASLANTQAQGQQQLQPTSPPPQVSSNGSSEASVFQNYQSVSDKKPAALPPAQATSASMANSQQQFGFANGQYPGAVEIVKAPKASDIRPPPSLPSSHNGVSQGRASIPSSSNSTDSTSSSNVDNTISAPSNQTNGNALASALELLVRSMQQAEQKPPPEPQRNELLRQILSASREYIGLAPPSGTESEQSIRNTLELIQLVGNQELKRTRPGP